VSIWGSSVKMRHVVDSMKSLRLEGSNVIFKLVRDHAGQHVALYTHAYQSSKTAISPTCVSYDIRLICGA
jgi:hypothetical protein